MKRLGRGLSAILEDAEAGYLKELPDSSISEIDIKNINLNPFQPRKEFDESSIDELAKSIEIYGLLQPIVVVKNENNYILVSGERRLRAFKKLGKNKIKAIVADLDLEELREYALIENIQRENLTPVEIALSLYELIKTHKYTHQELAKKLGKSRTYVTNLLRILTLPDEVIEKINKNEISFGHAKVLVNLDKEKAIEISKKIQKEKLSVRETEKLVKDLKNKNKGLNKNLKILETKFKKLGLKVELKSDYIKIKFKNETDFEKLKKLLDNIN